MHSLSDSQEQVFQGYLSVLDEVLLPSLCLLPSNCCMAEEAWAMVKQLPYQTRSVLSSLSHPVGDLFSLWSYVCHSALHVDVHCRYQLYGRWKNNSFQFHPELIDAKTETLTRGKFIMK